MKLSLESLTKNQLALITFAAWALPYFVINYITQFRVTHNFALSFESHIPFVPQFIYVYMLLYAFVVFPYFFLKNETNFYKAAKAYLVVIGITCIGFLLLPGTVIRPEVNVNGLSTWLVSFIYSTANPHNLLPSQHVALSALAALVCFHENKKVGAIMLFIAFMIAVSTLFVKQHYFLDIPTAWITAGGAYYYFFLRKQ